MRLIQLLCFTLLFSPLISSAGERDLAQEVEDPTAPLPTITLKSDYTTERQTYELTITNPYYLWNRANLLGVSLPGRGSAKILNLVVFDNSQSRYGVGLSAILKPTSGTKASLQYGPALGFVSRVNRCNLGLLNLNFFSADVSLSALQLIAGCSVGNNWNISSGNFLVIYDWRSGRLIEVPLSIQVGKVVNLLGQSLRAFINPRYNIQDTAGTARWTITAGFTLIADPSKSDK